MLAVVKWALVPLPQTAVEQMLGNTRIAQGLRGISLKTYLAPLITGAGALAIAVVGALVVGDETGTGALNSFVGRLSGSSASNIRGIAPAAFGFALVAGMVAAVNPCGFAMLPAYLSLYLGAHDRTQGRQNIAIQIGRALIVSLVVTGGFLLLFGAVGLIIGGGGGFIKGTLPWTGLITGIVLVLLGAWMLSGRKLYSNAAAQLASRIGDPNQVSIKGYFLFGLSYGIASLSCTLPIFLAVLGTNLTVSNLPSALGHMVLYGLGMGLVITALTVGMSMFKGSMAGVLRKVLPFVQPVSAVLMVVAGMYIVFYWLTLGRSLLGI